MSDSAGKPFAPSCERNRDPILDVLLDAFADRRRVLEIGSGTGQHAVYFASAMPQLVWQSSDQSEHLAGIRSWLEEAGLENTPPPIALAVDQPDWPSMRFDAVFTANTLHIMGWPQVEQLFARLPAVLAEDGLFAAYGPFNVDGRYTSGSNAAFDRWLHERGEHMGIRDLAAIDSLAATAGLRRVADHALPANNRCVIWRRSA